LLAVFSLRRLISALLVAAVSRFNGSFGLRFWANYEILPDWRSTASFTLCAYSKQGPVVKKLDPLVAKIGSMAIDWPKTVGSSVEFPVTTLVRNVGEQTLPVSGGAVDDALQVNMAYHWLSMDGSLSFGMASAHRSVLNWESRIAER
jgi:hypothetical protein